MAIDHTGGDGSAIFQNRVRDVARLNNQGQDDEIGQSPARELAEAARLAEYNRYLASLSAEDAEADAGTGPGR